MTLTVELSAEVLRRLEAEAARRGTTVDEVITELAAHLPDEATPSRHRLSFVGIGASGDTRSFDIHSERAELAERKLAEGI